MGEPGRKFQGQSNVWLVVSTHLKNISQIGSFPQVGVKIKNAWNHHLDVGFTPLQPILLVQRNPKEF